MAGDVPLVVLVIQHYYPGWKPPLQTRHTWAKTICPFHAEERASASISFELNAFKCHACGISGSAIGLIKLREEVSYAEAKRIAEKIAPGCDVGVSTGVPRQPSRRVFGEQGAGVPVDQGGDGQVHAGVRGRATPWT